MCRLKSLLRLLCALALLLCSLPLRRVAAQETPQQPFEGLVWTYTALGDSLAYGYPNVTDGYVPDYAKYIQNDTGNTVNLINLGVPGWTSSQLLDAVKNNQNFRTAIASSQVITFDIGGNDLNAALTKFQNGTCGGPFGQDCLLAADAQLKQNYAAILNEILSLRKTSNTIVLTMDIYNPFVTLLKSNGVLGLLKPYLDDVNAFIQTTAKANNVPCAQVYRAFNGVNGNEEANDKGYLTFDHFHPSTLGYKVIADQFRALGYTPLIGTVNSIDDAQFFVRRQYLDFLNRAPDASGFNFWTSQITNCGANQTCVANARVNVSAAFFLSTEFQQTGYFAYRFYKVAYNRQPRFAEFVPDAQAIGQNVVVGQGNWQQQLEQNKTAYANSFVASSAFIAKYPLTLTAAQYVDALNANAGNVLSTADRNALVNGLTAGTETRATVLRKIVDNQTLINSEFTRAFVLMEYFGYLRRNPDDPPDGNLNGYNFWLNKLNAAGGDYNKAEMVKAFINSTEYRQRFGAQ
jgi:lysophospholipase L1-like esterase